MSTSAPADAREQAVVGCPFCGGPARHLIEATDRNREITTEIFDYDRCSDCGTVFLANRPADLAPYYAGDYYEFDTDGEPIWKRNPLRLRSAAYRVELIRGEIDSGHLVEIGAGTGAFSCAARDAGFEVTAIDMSERCCRYLSEREGITTICSDRPVDALRALGPARAIAMWHVLEHLVNPTEVLEVVADRLEPGGVLAIGVPNPRSLQFRLMRARWAHLDAPRHLALIPVEALVRRARDLGLSCVARTTNDPEGLEFNQLGWTNALRRRPASGPATPIVGYAAFALSALLAPVERTGDRGTAITLLFQKGT